jgi:hypothetical protein
MNRIMDIEYKRFLFMKYKEIFWKLMKMKNLVKLILLNGGFFHTSSSQTGASEVFYLFIAYKYVLRLFYNLFIFKYLN